MLMKYEDDAHSYCSELANSIVRYAMEEYKYNENFLAYIGRDSTYLIDLEKRTVLLIAYEEKENIYRMAVCAEPLLGNETFRLFNCCKERRLFYAIANSLKGVEYISKISSLNDKFIEDINKYMPRFSRWAIYNIDLSTEEINVVNK